MSDNDKPDYDFDDLTDLLYKCSPNEPHDIWKEIGFEFKHGCHTLNCDGFDTFDTWSSQGEEYNKTVCRDFWYKYNDPTKPGGKTVSGLFKRAGQPTKKESGLERAVNDSSESSSRNPSQPIASVETTQNSTSSNSMSDAERIAYVQTQWPLLPKYNSKYNSDSGNPHHPYLVNKKLTEKLNGFEVNFRIGHDKNIGDFFAYPILDLKTREITAFNRIAKEGGEGKRLCYHAVNKGNATPIGNLDEFTSNVCICEGFSDALEIRYATKHTVLISHGTGNLPNVAKRVRELYPKCKIVICADNDKNNAGRNSANKAVKALNQQNVVVVYPVNKDFSLDVLAGLNISESIQKAIDDNSPVVTTAKEVTTKKENDSLVDHFHLENNGLFYTYFKNQGKEVVKVDIQITYNPFEIVAKTHDSYHDSWSKLISFRCDSGQIKQVVIPLSMTSGDGSEYRKLLLDSGLRISSEKIARGKLTEYLLTTDPSKTLHCLDKTGWYNGVYVLPGQVIGTTNEEILLQTSNSIKESYESKGTLEEWQEKVALYCIGNSRLTFAVSYAFASMLLEFSDADSGGVQFIGQSSIGKSTVAFVSASVFGGRSYVNQWRNTSNALESVATARNDSLLILDEMGQVESKEVGSIAYMLANGSGKGRMDKSANLKPTSKWRLLFLSTGEVGLVDHMKSSGKQTMAGQESRLIDLPADTGKYGIFESLHECKDGSELSRLLRSNTKKFYGTAQREYLTRLLQIDANTLIDMIDTLTNKFLDDHVPKGSDGQVMRVAQRFALGAIGGEIATKLGITGWSNDDSEKAAVICLNDWLQARGGIGSIEEKNALQKVRYFFEQFAFSRFKDIKTVGTEDEKTVQNLAGFRETTGVGDDAETRFYVYPGVFTEEICKGLNSKLVAKICIDYGFLEVGTDGRSTKLKRLPNTGKDGGTRMYWFTNKVLSD